MRQTSAFDPVGRQPARRGPSRVFGRRLWLAIACFAIPGAAAEQPGLEGTWRLSSVAATPVAAPSADQLPFFTVKGTDVEGFDGCNHFFGPLEPPGAIGATRRACPDVTLVLPLDLNELAAHLRSGRIEEDVLTVPARGPYPASSYVRPARPEGSASTAVEPADPGSAR